MSTISINSSGVKKEVEAFSRYASGKTEEMSAEEARKVASAIGAGNVVNIAVMLVALEMAGVAKYNERKKTQYRIDYKKLTEIIRAQSEQFGELLRKSHSEVMDRVNLGNIETVQLAKVFEEVNERLKNKLSQVNEASSFVELLEVAKLIGRFLQIGYMLLGIGR